MMEKCLICNRNIPANLLEEHHLIPKCLNKRKKYKKFPKNQTIKVCIDCGNQIHQLFTEKELADNLNTLEKILENEKIINWQKWIAKKPNDFNINMKSKKRK
jgi:NMD protein affecting ribosome stability and mRNA decay